MKRELVLALVVNGGDVVFVLGDQGDERAIGHRVREVVPQRFLSLGFERVRVLLQFEFG